MAPVDPMLALAAAVLQVGRPEPERVLEVECGEGERLLFLAREFPRARLRGVDASAERIARATARVGLDPEGRVAFKQGERSRLPFPDDHFDLVVQVEGGPAIEEAARVLRDGGRFVVVRARRPADPLGLRRRRAGRRLRRSGFERLQRGGAGGGSFFVMRLRGAARGAPSD